MNIYEKVQAIRVELNRAGLKMSGKNDYAKYDYFELSDFLPKLNELMQSHKMTAVPSFSLERATLTAINIEAPEERFTIESPFGGAELKGCHDVQNIGAVETYQRRYLYQAMFDISEKDSLNQTQGKPGSEKSEKRGISLTELGELGIEDTKAMAKWLGEKFGKSISEFDEADRKEALTFVKKQVEKRKAREKALKEAEGIPAPWDDHD